MTPLQAKVTTPSSSKAPNQEPLICQTVRCRKPSVLCVLVFFTVAFSFHFRASPSRSWAVSVHPGNVTHWRPSSDSVSGVPPNARLLPNSPVQHSCTLPPDAPLLSHTNLGICFLSLSLYVSSGSVSRLLRRSLTLLETQRASVQEAQNVPALGVQSRVVEEHKRLVGNGYGCAVSRPAALAASATFLHLVMIIRQSNLNEHKVAPVWMSNVLSTRRDLHQGQNPQARCVSDVRKRRGRSKREKEETEGERREKNSREEEKA